MYYSVIGNNCFIVQGCIFNFQRLKRALGPKHFIYFEILKYTLQSLTAII